MSYETITYEVEDQILTLTLNRPDKLNALSVAMRDVIFKAVDDLRDRDDLRVLLIRATGKYWTPENATLVVVGDAQKIQKPLEKIGTFQLTKPKQ